jgi:hypothetical protein
MSILTMEQKEHAIQMIQGQIPDRNLMEYLITNLRPNDCTFDEYVAFSEAFYVGFNAHVEITEQLIKNLKADIIRNKKGELING